MDCKIRWLGQAGYILQSGNHKVCIDPYLSDSVEKKDGLRRKVGIPVRPEDLEADIIIVTHDHIDHLDEDTISKVRQNIKLAGPESCINHFRAMGIEEKRLIIFNSGDDLNVGGFLFRAVYARHTKDSIGIVLMVSDRVLYFTGDTIYDENLVSNVYKPDIIFTCINGKLGNMNYEEAVNLTVEVEASIGIPNHFDMFAENSENPELYLEGLSKYGIRGCLLDFNVEYDLEGL